jgi:endoplasmic reticulum-Golgi intermediate compartment protein 3
MDFFRSLDAFPKAIDDFRVRTSSGAIVSLIAIAMMIMLFFGELNYYLKVETVDYLYVNSVNKQQVTASFDISFPEIPCKLLSIDAIDDMGMTQKDIISEVFKHKIDKNGYRIGEGEKHYLGNTMKTEEELQALSNLKDIPNNENINCGNCYGAAQKGVCCNTCQEVRVAYAQMGWLFKPQEVLQCRREAVLETLKDQNAEDGGCEIYGNLKLSTSSGHFHIVPQKTITGTKDAIADGYSLLDLLSFTFAQFNITHTVNSLSFGDNFPGFKSPLDGEQRTIRDTHGMYQYYIKTVPTKYIKLDGNEIIESHQYSVTEHMRHLAPGSGRGLPGVYFYYESSPVQAIFEETRGSFLRFFTSLCAILGGLYTVMGMIDTLIVTASTYLRKEVL